MQEALAMRTNKRMLQWGASAALTFSAAVFAVGGDVAVKFEAADDAPGVAAAQDASGAKAAKAGVATAAKSQQPGVATAEKPAKAAVEKPKRLPLGEDQIALRDEVRRTLAAYRQIAFNTQQNTATEIQGVCLAFGCDTEITLGGDDGRRINGITALCWNYPCNGYEMLSYRQRHIAPRIGYGYQENPSEFLAMLAMSRVPATYPIRVGKDVRKVSDIIAAEKLACRSGGDASFRLIALSYYVDEDGWKNDLGETWSIDRLVGEELKRPSASGSEQGIDRLLGLSCAVKIQLHRGETLNGSLQRANQYIVEFQRYAIQLQNPDGTWGPMFLAARSKGADIASQVYGTGRVLEWLTMSLSDDSLQNPRIFASVDVAARLLGDQQLQSMAPSLSTRSIVSIGHALHALSVYDERVFKPYDVEEKPAEKPVDKQASAQQSTVR
jgi:hypothetical protein